MRILFCNKYNYPFSGTEVYLFELMELMRERGHEVALFSMQDARGIPTPYDRQEFVSSLKVTVIGSRALFGWWATGDLQAIVEAVTGAQKQYPESPSHAGRISVSGPTGPRRWRRRGRRARRGR